MTKPPIRTDHSLVYYLTNMFYINSYRYYWDYFLIDSINFQTLPHTETKWRAFNSPSLPRVVTANVIAKLILKKRQHYLLNLQSEQ